MFNSVQSSLKGPDRERLTSRTVRRCRPWLGTSPKKKARRVLTGREANTKDSQKIRLSLLVCKARPAPRRIAPCKGGKLILMSCPHAFNNFPLIFNLIVPARLSHHEDHSISFKQIDALESYTGDSPLYSNSVCWQNRVER